MSNVLETGRVVWNKATWTLNEVTDPRPVSFVGDGRTFTIADLQGNELAYLTLAPDPEGNYTVERLDAKTYRLTGEDGNEWVVKAVGCGCGGR